MENKETEGSLLWVSVGFAFGSYVLIKAIALLTGIRACYIAGVPIDDILWIDFFIGLCEGASILVFGKAGRHYAQKYDDQQELTRSNMHEAERLKLIIYFMDQEKLTLDQAREKASTRIKSFTERLGSNEIQEMRNKLIENNNKLS